MKKYEQTNSTRVEVRNMEDFGKEVAKKGREWRAANPKKVKATKEQRNKLKEKINNASKEAK